jgi:hypothetical protein
MIKDRQTPVPPINRWAIFGRPSGTGLAATRQIITTLPETVVLRQKTAQPNATR